MLFRKYLDLSRTYFELFSKVLRSFENTLVLIEHPLDCTRSLESYFWSSRAARELFLELHSCSRATFGAPGLLASYFWSSRVVLVSSLPYFRSFWVDLLDPLLSQTILRRMGRKKKFHCDFFFFGPFWPILAWKMNCFPILCEHP